MSVPVFAPASDAERDGTLSAIKALEQRLVAAEEKVRLAHLAQEEARAARADARTARRQMRTTWAVAGLASLFAVVLGANPAARAQFGLTLTSLDTRLKAVESKTANMSALTDDDGNATVRFSNVNVQIVSGSGSTQGAINGRGNLIVGYNENGGTNDHTGSHNIISGTYQSYTSYGGLIVGAQNTVSGPYASVTGGQSNVASGNGSSVSGGTGNVTDGGTASVSGGAYNSAHGVAASISGGKLRTMSTVYGWAAGSVASGGFTPGNFSSP